MIMKNEVLVVIPTFNEKENIAELIDAIERESLEVDLLVVDDNSPDGTGKIVDEIVKEKKFVSVMHREKKEGLGRAYIAGFKWGMERGYQKFISMDADFSHPIKAIPNLIKLCDSKTLAIGSRYIKGGKIVGWNTKRFVNSWGANLFTRTLLRLKAKDVTSGFKCFPIEFLNSIDLDAIQGSGYAFLVEMSLLAQEKGFLLKETPITFTDRVAGESKISGELKKSIKLVFQLAIAKKSYRQFAKFAVVGLSCAIIDWGIFYLLKIVLGRYAPDIDLQAARQISKAASFVVSASVNYYFNRIWTFKSRDSAVVAQATKFFIVAFIGLLFNSAIFYLVTASLGWRDIFGLVVATAIVTLWNFFLNKKWTFKVK